MLRSILLASARFSTEVQKTSAKSTGASGLTSYRDGQLVSKSALVLKKQEDIEAYVVKTVQNYFRTTYKQGTLPPTQVSARAARSPSTASTRSTPSRSPCRSRRTSATPSPLRRCPPSPRSSTTSPTSSRSRPSSARTARTPSPDYPTYVHQTGGGQDRNNGYGKG